MNEQTLDYLRAGTKILDRTDDKRILFAEKFDDESTNADHVMWNGIDVGDDEVAIVEIFINDTSKNTIVPFTVKDADFEALYVISG